MSRDPIGKSLVVQFTAEYPTETDEQIHARLQRAWSSAGAAGEVPVTVEDVAGWRPEVQS